MLRPDTTRSARCLVIAAGLSAGLGLWGCHATAPAGPTGDPARGGPTATAERAPVVVARAPARATVLVEGTGAEGEATRQSLQDLGQRVAARCAPPNAGVLRVVFEQGRLASVDVWPEAAREPGTHACVMEQIAIANLGYLRDGADGEPMPASVLIRVEW